ncbi:monocarboxylate transporter 13 [Scleropages formosus]|uniref:monocarboxylate transporter 13 n=1 Tax=Scleropages formosus TaxID=113540 RepID=UPI0010FABF48|nr:monocarboxylate transporter 13-like [Scleropages formosus]
MQLLGARLSGMWSSDMPVAVPPQGASCPTPGERIPPATGRWPVQMGLVEISDDKNRAEDTLSMITYQRQATMTGNTPLRDKRLQFLLRKNSPMEKRFSAQGSAPDGGYGWLVLASAFFVFGLTFGIVKAFGVFYVEINQYFATSATEASWITSIAVATVHIGAPIGAVLSTRYGHRAVVMAGGLLAGVGMVGGSLSQNLVQLYMTVGFLSGLGYAICWTPTMTMLALYFERRRPMANGLASAGECIMTFLITPFFQLLVDWYSWRGAMLVLAGLELNLSVCGALLRPLTLAGDSPGNKASPQEAAAPSERPTTSQSGGAVLQKKVLHYVDYTLITNKRFIIYSLSGVFAALGFFAPALFLVPYARSRGVEEYQAASLMSISAAFDLTGRLACGWIANLRLWETIKLLMGTMTMLGAVLLMCPLAKSFSELAIFSAAYGLTFGATVSIHITVLVEVVGVAQLGSALSFFMLIRSSGGLLGPPIAGAFIDKMSDYGMGFLIAGVALIVSALFLLLLQQINSRGQRSSKMGHLPVEDERDGLDCDKTEGTEDRTDESSH